MSLPLKPFYNPGDIVFAPFPYSEQNADKDRTMVVVSTVEFNRTFPVFIGVKISKTKMIHHSVIPLLGYEKDSCGLNFDSYIYSTLISSVSNNLITEYIGVLPNPRKKELLSYIRQFFGW